MNPEKIKILFHVSIWIACIALISFQLWMVLKIRKEYREQAKKYPQYYNP